MSRTRHPWAVGLAAGVAAGLLAVPVAVQVHPGDTPAAVRPPGDRVRHAIDGLRRDHFYVGPELRDRLTDTEFQAISDAAQQAATPTYVVWWDDVGSDGGFGAGYEANDQIMAAIGEDGYYAVVTNGRSSAELDAVGYDRPDVDSTLAQGRPQVALLRFVKALGAAPREEEYTDSSDYWGGPGGGLAAGALIAGPSFLLLLAVVRVAALFRRRT
jgi:hypothetical protein